MSATGGPNCTKSVGISMAVMVKRAPGSWTRNTLSPWNTASTNRTSPPGLTTMEPPAATTNGLASWVEPTAKVPMENSPPASTTTVPVTSTVKFPA